MRVIDADASHLAEIEAIVNDVIANTTAIYVDEPTSREDTLGWFEAKRSAGLPVIVAIDAEGVVAGFASYGPFNQRHGYRYTVEHSLHVAPSHRGEGVGRSLLEAIVERARNAGMHAMVGVIDAGNTASCRLHESAGFELVGQLPEVGRKFDRWLDVCFYHKRLS